MKITKGNMEDNDEVEEPRRWRGDSKLFLKSNCNNKMC